MSRALARPRLSTNAWPRSMLAGRSRSGRFFVACGAALGSFSGWRFSRMEAIRQVREVKTGGLEKRR